MRKLKSGDVIVDYRIIKEYAEGGMSSVYLAEMNNNKSEQDYLDEKNRYVIVKIISRNKDDSDESWNKAKDEFQMSWQVYECNENVVQPLYWNVEPDHIILVFEFVDGPTLARLLHEQKTLSVDQTMYYFEQLVKGLQFFHHVNEKTVLIHRDIKMDNILLSKDLRQLKIADYGIATSIYDNIINSNEGVIYCTASYTTPDITKITSGLLRRVKAGDEKAKKEMQNIVTVQFDFHAIGVILYEMITGNHPFNYNPGEKDMAKIKRWLKHDVPSMRLQVPNVPNSLENMVFRCTASKPADIKYRYKSIDEIYDDISTWNNPERKDEPLLKPFDKRQYEVNDFFDINKLRQKEKFYHHWWFFNLSLALVAFLIIVTIVLVLVSNN